jgi:hypothetical protein
MDNSSSLILFRPFSTHHRRIQVNYSEQNLSIDNISEVLSSDIVIDEELIGKRYCKCGSATHQRTSFKSC